MGDALFRGVSDACSTPGTTGPEEEASEPGTERGAGHPGGGACARHPPGSCHLYIPCNRGPHQYPRPCRGLCRSPRGMPIPGPANINPHIHLPHLMSQIGRSGDAVRGEQRAWPRRISGPWFGSAPRGSNPPTNLHMLLYAAAYDGHEPGGAAAGGTRDLAPDPLRARPSTWMSSWPASRSLGRPPGSAELPPPVSSCAAGGWPTWVGGCATTSEALRGSRTATPRRYLGAADGGA